MAMYMGKKQNSGNKELDNPTKENKDMEIVTVFNDNGKSLQELMEDLVPSLVYD